jgi:perosamine synthetase
MIPVFEPIIGDTEIAYVTDALRRGEISGNFGAYLDPIAAASTASR